MHKVTNSDGTSSLLNKESQFFAKSKSFQHFTPYHIKQQVKKPTTSSNKVALAKRSNSHIPATVPNLLKSVETASKIYRIPNREKTNSYKEESTSDVEDFFASNDVRLQIGPAVEKPKPPSAVTLKYNSTFSSKPRRVAGNIPSRANKRTKTKEKENASEKTDQKKVYETNVLPTKVYKKQDVLSSLRKLSLIEPFLNATESSINPLLDNLDGEPLTISSKDVIKLDQFVPNKKGSTTKPFISSQNASQNTLTSNQELVRIDKPCISMRKSVKDEHNSKYDDSHVPTTKERFLSAPCSYKNDMFLAVTDNAGYRLNNEQLLDTSDNDSFVYRDSYNNKISVKKESDRKLLHGTPISIVTSLKEPLKLIKKPQLNLTQRQLSFVGATLPTATVVDISTGSVIENNGEDDNGNSEVVNDNVDNLRSLAGSKAGAPSSFYHNRKIKRRKQDDRAEMLELNKLKEQAQHEIMTILKNSESEQLIKNPTNPTTPDVKNSSTKAPIEYKIVQIPNPVQKLIQVESEVSKSCDSVESEKTSSRCSSSLTQSSSTSSTKQPCVPNPSPQLAPNRFQIFPTGNPNTYHAYSSKSSKPTVISVDHFSHARASLNDQKNRKNKQRTSKSYHKTTNGLGYRFAVNTDIKLPKRYSSLKTGTLIKGESISLKNQFQSEGEMTDNETSDENPLKSSSDDETKLERLPPPHTLQKFFKFSTSGAGKVKKVKESSEQVVYKPLQSLVIKSCQSVNPVLVMPEAEPNVAERETLSAMPNRPQMVNGHLSPLKGIRIINRKVTMRHYESDNYPYLEKAGVRYFFTDSKTMSRFAKSAQDKDDTINADPNRNLFSSNPSTRNTQKNLDSCSDTDYIDPGAFVESKTKSKHLQTRFDSEDSAKPQVSNFDFTDNSINIHRLSLNGEKAEPFLLLKEGSMQSLNFLNPNSLHFSTGSLSVQDAKNAAERSAKKRRKIQLGTNGTTDDCISVKIAAGGGFKSNVSRYSLLLRQKYHKQQDETNQKSLQREEILEISKAGIEPVSKTERRIPKLLSRPSSKDKNQLPAVRIESSNKETNNTNGTEILTSQSRLKFRELLENYCNDNATNEEIFAREFRTAAASRRQSNEIENGEQNKYFSLNKTPSLNDIAARLSR